MAAIKSKNTRPEKLIRSGLHARGLRFRLHDNRLPGNPDIVFPTKYIAIFVNGCFWHAHQDCRYFKIPKTDTLKWTKKLEGNCSRDLKNHEALKKLGWQVKVVWECSVRGRQPEEISRFLDELALFVRSSEGLDN